MFKPVAQMLAVILVACVSVPVTAAGNSDWHPGENLVTPFQPDSSEWTAYRKEVAGLKSRMWRKESEPQEMYAVSLISDADFTLEGFRERQDASGWEHCASFSSDIVSEEDVNGYPQLTWQTLCNRSDGRDAVVLQKAIIGNDKLYHVQKVWLSEPAEEAVSDWRERIADVVVCDTRGEEHPCPEGYERVESE